MGEPGAPENGAEAEAEAELEALRRLEARLERATAAAERLIAQAARAGVGPEVPASGWRAAGDSEREPPGSAWVDPEDARRLSAVLAGMLERIPVELQQRLAAAVREVLLALRALLDWCRERAERRRRAPVEVQDIPIL